MVAQFSGRVVLEGQSLFLGFYDFIDIILDHIGTRFIFQETPEAFKRIKVETIRRPPATSAS
jgi:hypothetical protein